MGRGLSELQKAMLELARESLPYHWDGYVYFNDVFVKVYGWPDPGKHGEGMLESCGRFPKKEIGLKRYMAAKIAVRKSAQRLVKRGLIYIPGHHGAGYSLTMEGREFLLAEPCNSIVAPSENVKGPSTCSLYDGMYKCSACGVIFEPFGAKSFPQQCSFCGKSGTLQRYHP